jgi:hypothetical protein
VWRFTLPYDSMSHHTITAAQGYEDELVQALALSVMPLEALRGAAQEACELSQAMGEEPLLDFEDALALELLVWFKQDFFCWVRM